MFRLTSISRTLSGAISLLRVNQHPHAHLLGDGGDGILRRCGREPQEQALDCRGISLRHVSKESSIAS